MREKPWRGVFHWDPEKQAIVDGPAPTGPRRDVKPVARGSANGGVSFQFPKYWDDGSGKVRHVPSGPFKGRVMFGGPQEAADIGKRHEDMCGYKTTYDK